MKRLVLLSLLSAIAAHGAIKKVDGPPKSAPADPAKPKAENKPKDEAKPKTEAAPKAPSKPEPMQINPAELEKFLREKLEEAGVPKKDLEGKPMRDLLRMAQSKPKVMDAMAERLGLAQGSMFRKPDPEVAEKLDSQFKGWLEGHKPGTVKAGTATFSFRDGATKADPNVFFEPLIFGTGVHADGWIFTKASEVKKAKQLQCRVKGTWVAAKVARVWEEHDLALVQVAAKELPTVEWSKNAIPGLGSFLSAVAPDGREPMAIGVVSVAQRSQRRGFLGVKLLDDKLGVKISEVVKDGAAFIAGVLAEDTILEVDGKKPESYMAFSMMVGSRQPGDKVKLKLQRGKDVLEKEIKLGKGQDGPNRPVDRANAMGSKISDRRENFPSIVQTDFPMNANQCGGPVTDLDGNVLGLVIARSGRVDTLFIPSETIQATLAAVDFAQEADTLVKAEATAKAEAAEKAKTAAAAKVKAELTAKVDAAAKAKVEAEKAEVEAKAKADAAVKAKAEAVSKAEAAVKAEAEAVKARAELAPKVETPKAEATTK